jgi:hypothetical protein
MLRPLSLAARDRFADAGKPIRESLTLRTDPGQADFVFYLINLRLIDGLTAIMSMFFWVVFWVVPPPP